jgi:CHAT domain-containing protein
LGTDGISSLSNAFFYAGARALLISHWRVDSTAAVHLTTKMIQYAVENPNKGYNIALKYSILKLMNDKKNPHFAHPLFWAPFVIVGEGGKPS